MKRKVIKTILLVSFVFTTLVSCTLGGGLTSKTFDIEVSSIESNDDKHSIVLDFGKTKEDLKYFLYQNGEEIANDNVGTKGGSKEYILDNGDLTEITYKIKIVSGEEELIKEYTYTVGSEPLQENNDSEEGNVDADKSDPNNGNDNEDADNNDEGNDAVDEENTQNDDTTTNNDDENDENQGEEDTQNPDESVSSNDSDVKEWSGESVNYESGQKVTQDGVVYECINAHTSQGTWAPNNSESLWKKAE